MKAILTRAYACAPEGHTVLKFEAGQTIEGTAASMALADGAAIEVQDMDPIETKVEAPEETKAPRKRARKA